MNTEKRNDRIKNMLCFVPFFSIVIYFIEKNKTDIMIKNIVYSVFLIILFFIISILTKVFIGFIIYIFSSFYLWYKSYIWEDVSFDFIDNIFLKKK